MKTNFRFLALSAAILTMFTACQREELEQNQKPEALTHSVTFVAGAPETKTTATIDGNTVNYAWTAEDVDRFTVYENGIAATEIKAELGDDGIMSMKATFTGEAPASPKYQALYNSEVSATQIVSENSYAEVSDVMVSNVLDGTRDNTFFFSFKREVAFAKMTLKGLTSGAYVSSVTIKSDKPIAGKYDLETGTFVNTSNVITLDVLTDIADGNATVWFTTIPVEDATFTITAETTDDEETVAGTYTKTFSKPITLTRGDVKGFGVACQRVSLEEIQLYSTEFNYNMSGSSYSSPNEIEGTDSEGGTSWGITYGNWNGSNCAQFRVYSSSLGDFGSLYMKFDLPKVSRVSYKAKVKNSSTNVRLNTYYSTDSGNTWIPVDENKSLTDKWTDYEFVVSSKGEYENVRVKFEASGSRNTSSTEELTIDDVVIYGVEYGAPKYNINIETVEGGELSASASSAKAGTEITLVANPDTGYNFNNDWLVKDSDGNEIPVVDEKFTMPAKDVTVTASFSKIAYTINTPSNDRGTISVKIGGSEVTEANYGDEITLSATPAEGYEFINWSVTDKDDKVVVVTDGKFTMPASPVTVNAYFRSSATYTASFSVNGSIISTKTYKENDKIAFPENPTIDGVDFMGWTTTAIDTPQKNAPDYVSKAVMGRDDVTFYAVFATKYETEVTEEVQTLAYDTWTYAGSTTNKSSYRLFHSGSYIESAEFDLSKLSRVVVYGGTFGGDSYNKLTIGDGNKTWKSVTVSGKSETGVNTYTDGTPLTGTGKLRITSNSGTASDTGVRISKVEIYFTKVGYYYDDYCTKVVTLSSIAISGSPTKNEYTEGEEFDPSGLIVTGTYSDGKSKVISTGIIWTSNPNPLTEGTTSVTVTAKVGSISSAEYVVKDLTVTAGSGGGETDPYEIVFLTSSSDGNNTISPSTDVSTVVSEASSGYIASFTSNCSKAYYKCKSGVKLGTKDKAGTLEFNLADAVKNNVVSIKVETAKFGTDTGTITMYNGSSELKRGIAPADGYTHTFTSPTTVGTLKFVTSSKRAYISKITITVGN